MRVDYRKAFPAGFRAMAALERAVHESTLEPGLLELVKIRASQINGCTYRLAMHTRDARARGEHQTRLDTVAAWREAPFFTDQERAALAWCEALTELPRTGAPHEVFAEVRGRVLRNRDRRADLRDRGHQRLEPARRRAALGRHDPRRPRPSRSAEPGRGVRPISSPRASASYQYRGWPGMLSRSARTRARSSPSAMSAAAAKAWSVHSRARPGSPATAWARASAS